MVWAALLNKDARGRAGKGKIWTKALRIPFAWFRAFLRSEEQGMTRQYTLDAYLRRGIKLRITCDASPWAVGAYLIINDVVVEYLHEPISITDASIMNCEIGSCKSQQAFESFALLLALRTWCSYWRKARMVLTVRSDSVAALTMLLKMKSAGNSPAVVARELAIFMSKACYIPEVVEHLPGVANTLADLLSRWHEPGKQHSERPLPAMLQCASLRICPPRSRQWWHSLDPP